MNANTTYHFRIVSQDTEGYTRTTSDRTFTTRSPRTYRVPEDYSTIQEALDQARSCDTVQVAPGNYNGHFQVREGILLLGAGSDKTTIDGEGRSGSVITAYPGSQIEGFTITGSGTNYFDSGIWHSEGRITVRRNRFTGNTVGLFSWCFNSDCAAEAVIENNIFDHNTRIAIDANKDPIHKIVNNTIVFNSRGVVLNNSHSVAENNIIVNNTGDGLVDTGKGATARYNDVWQNGRNYLGLTPGLGDVSVDPRFINPASGDYHLRVDSPVKDAGNPGAAYLDIDGTRNDMGRYGGPHSVSQCDLVGDFDNSHMITGKDVKALATHWREHAGSLNWDPMFDLNNDAVVNVFDILLLSTHLGEQCPE